MMICQKTVKAFLKAHGADHQPLSWKKNNKLGRTDPFYPKKKDNPIFFKQVLFYQLFDIPIKWPRLRSGHQVPYSQKGRQKCHPPIPWFKKSKYKEKA